jgi:hypothetical protein
MGYEHLDRVLLPSKPDEWMTKGEAVNIAAPDTPLLVRTTFNTFIIAYTLQGAFYNHKGMEIPYNSIWRVFMPPPDYIATPDPTDVPF